MAEGKRETPETESENRGIGDKRRQGFSSSPILPLAGSPFLDGVSALSQGCRCVRYFLPLVRVVPVENSGAFFIA